MHTLSILGSTGSVGQSTLDVVARHPDQYKIVALSANNNVEKMLAQCEQFHPKLAVMADFECAEKLQKKLKTTAASGTQVLAGSDAINQIAADPDCESLMSAIVGAAGLLPTLEAVKAGKRVFCLLYTSPSPRDQRGSRMPSSA